MKASKITVYSVIALVLVSSMTACTRTSSANSNYSAPSCTQLLTSAIAHERHGTGNINSTMQALSEECSDEFEIAVDYLSNSIDSEFSIDSCDELLGYGVRAESVALLEEDGQCTFGESEAFAAGPDWPEGGLGWDRAQEYAGTVQRVCGPLMSARETVDGTFINIGRDYPSVNRFTFIFWDMYLEPIASGATICGSGEIYLYNGVAQMAMQNPSSLEIWR